MSWTSQELGAIGRYAKMHGLRLMLCNRPTVVYLDHQGKEVKVDIQTVNVAAETNKKEEATERRRIKTAEKREQDRLDNLRRYR